MPGGSDRPGTGNWRLFVNGDPSLANTERWVVRGSGDANMLRTIAKTDVRTIVLLI